MHFEEFVPTFVLFCFFVGDWASETIPRRRNIEGDRNHLLRGWSLSDHSIYSPSPPLENYGFHVSGMQILLWWYCSPSVCYYSKEDDLVSGMISYLFQFCINVITVMLLIHYVTKYSCSRLYTLYFVSKLAIS